MELHGKCQFKADATKKYANYNGFVSVKRIAKCFVMQLGDYIVKGAGVVKGYLKQ